MTRVLVGDDADIGEARRNRTHRRPLREVALPGGPEHRPEPPGGRPAKLAEHGLQRVGGVRVIDHDLEGLAEVDALHPPADRHGCLETADRALEIGTRRARGAQRRERVADVEAPGKAQRDRYGAPRCPRREANAARRRGHVGGADVGVDVGGVRVGEPGGDWDRRQPWEGERVTRVEDRDAVCPRRHLLEQTRLGGEVALAAAVQLQVLRGDPGEDGRPEGDVVDPMHLETVRGGLEGDVRATQGTDRGKVCLELRRLGRREP